MLEKELISTFQDDSRVGLRIQAHNSIIKNKNKRNYNKKRKKTKNYQDKDFVAIKCTQQSSYQESIHKFIEPYKITKVFRKDRYLV